MLCLLGLSCIHTACPLIDSFLHAFCPCSYTAKLPLKKLKPQQNSECEVADFTYSWLSFNLMPCNLAFSSQNSSDSSLKSLKSLMMSQDTKLEPFFLVLILPTFPTAIENLDYPVRLFLSGLSWQRQSLIHRDASNKNHFYVMGLWVILLLTVTIFIKA